MSEEAIEQNKESISNKENCPWLLVLLFFMLADDCPLHGEEENRPALN